MDRSSIATLIQEVITTDEIQQEIVTEVEHEIYCDISSVSGDEFARASQVGIRPQYRLSMFKYDYNGELTVEIDGQRYGVYRTYEGRNDSIELYLERKAGV